MSFRYTIHKGKYNPRVTKRNPYTTTSPKKVVGHKILPVDYGATLKSPIYQNYKLNKVLLKGPHVQRACPKEFAHYRVGKTESGAILGSET